MQLNNFRAADPRKQTWIAVVVMGHALCAAGSLADDAANADALVFFESKIRPLFVEKCYTCHSANTNAKGGLRVDDLGGLLVGGNRGAAIFPGQPDQSLLLRAVSYNDKRLKMPPEEKLSDEEITNLTKWVADGAHWPAVELPEEITEPNEDYEKLKREHWAWQPLVETAPPKVNDPVWSQDAVDRFVLAKLEENKLRPTGNADKVALIRRVTFDLTGLPPSPEEVDAFLADDSVMAYAKVVDRLLASPAFGERWGRHWLDVARYAESTGSSRNMPYPHAWRYRDYVIDSFNEDKPYDQFLREQIAGDLLPAEDEAQREEQLIATGFLALGVKDVNQRFKVRFTMDNIDEQIDTVTRSVLAVTASCARCHDHKFDPVSTSDYYALAGIFHSTELCAGVRNKMGGGGLEYYNPESLVRLTSQETPVDPEALAAAQAEFDKAKRAWDDIRGTPKGLERGKNGKPKQRPFRVKFERAQAELMQLSDPAHRGAAALGVREGAQIGDTEIRIRGEAEQLGPKVPRGFLSLLASEQPPEIPADESGRLQLAEWLTAETNPLTPRVMVNRIWQHLFGQGLVTTSDNFGVMGDTPSHPELLDYLAIEFSRNGWSVKSMVRSLVLTRTYQLSSAEVLSNVEVDPGNKLLWRHEPRRLDAEELRDAALAAAGNLDLTRPEASPARDLKVVELLDSSPVARRLELTSRRSVSRSVYLPLLRNLTPLPLQVFDFAEQGMVTGTRDATTVATQALFLLNDTFIRKQSIGVAQHVLNRDGLEDAARIDLAYRLVLGRSATAAELSRVSEYVSDYEATASGLLTKQEGQLLAQASPPSAETLSDSGEVPNEEVKEDPPRDPDEIPAEAAPIVEEQLPEVDAKTAAWASFCQALFASAEFRYSQ
jgi:cytochrome c553